MENVVCTSFDVVYTLKKRVMLFEYPFV